MSIRRQGATVTAVTLAGVLALGACVTQRTGSEDTREEGRTAQVELAEAEGRAEARAAAVRLQQLRLRYPTAGTEVPPADLVRTSSDDRTGTLVRPTLLHRYLQ